MRDQSWTRRELLRRISDYASAAGATAEASTSARLDEAHAGPLGEPTLPWLWPTPASARLGAWPSPARETGAPTLAVRAQARATLPLLAQGASGLIDWRRKRLATTSA